MPFGLGAGETEEAVQIPMKFTVGDTIQYIRDVSVGLYCGINMQTRRVLFWWC